MFEGYGTRIKILENLILGNRILSTSKGIEGIDYKNNYNVVVCNNLYKMINHIIKFSKSKKVLELIQNQLINFQC